jgi:hypothetical protein
MAAEDPTVELDWREQDLAGKGVPVQEELCRALYPTALGANSATRRAGETARSMEAALGRARVGGSGAARPTSWG